MLKLAFKKITPRLTKVFQFVGTVKSAICRDMEVEKGRIA